MHAVKLACLSAADRAQAQMRRSSYSVGARLKSYELASRELVGRRVYDSLARTRFDAYERPVRATSNKVVPTPIKKSMICLLIAAHNEELVLGNTIQSAINAGMKPEHIYVVDDNSTDITSKIARSLVPRENVIKVRRSGKGLALAKGAKKFQLVARYRWIHIADADGAFASDYFTVLRREMRVEFAAVTGYMKSLPGKMVSDYRAYEYTVAMEFYRRLQVMLGVIPVIPGPTSCFRSDVFSKLTFANSSLTEDFDVTLQVYRKNLGKIQYIPEAVAYTQDPLTFDAFVRQVTRWYRGGMQVMLKHKIGTKLTPIDIYLSHQVLQGLVWFFSLFVWTPYMVATHGGPSFVASLFVFDVFITFLMALLATISSKRLEIIAAFPMIYALKWVNLLVFFRSFVEVVILKKYRLSDGLWSNDSNRRYRLAS